MSPSRVIPPAQYVISTGQCADGSTVPLRPLTTW
jgi:hypothetical protein